MIIQGKRLYTCLFLLLLASCSDNDATSDTNPETDGGLPESPSGETSNPAPEGDVPENPLPSAPGGDTSAIAGLWNARSTESGSVDERYVHISADGVYTEFDYRQDDLADDGNCYLRAPSLTLTPEDLANHAYSLPDDRYFNATSNDDGTVLRITFAEQSLQAWDVATGLAVEDFAGCENIQE